MTCRPCLLLVLAGICLSVASVAAHQPGTASPKTSPQSPDAKPAEPQTAPKPGDAGKDAAPSGKPDDKKNAAKNDPAYVLDFKMKRIDGQEEDLNIYKGKVVVIVNVASKCGYTPQYEGLEKLYEQKKDAGLVVMGFPANDFRKQEPGTDDEIKAFCTSKYNVTFPMFAKITVKGDESNPIAPLYKKLTDQPAPIGGEIKWNFTKFLVDRSGKVVARFESKVAPDDAAFVKKIDELLTAAEPAKKGSTK